MFNDFEGNADERLLKEDDRLSMLKRAKEAGYFDEEGTEKVTVKAAGINPCDLGYSTFTGEAPEPKPGEYPVKWPCNKPNCTYCTQQPRQQADHTNMCRKCGGFGDLVLYGSDELERCPACAGTGRNDIPLCFVCNGRGCSIDGARCPMCNGRGLEATP